MLQHNEKSYFLVIEILKTMHLKFRIQDARKPLFLFAILVFPKLPLSFLS